ncbi:MAG: RNA polymerase-binding protein DksA [Desulfobacterales bacterium]|jgi:DnaK suppressor protein|nr:RNA polymerase-binding protein DksA [Desulfobacterales bacterium]
MKKKDLDFFKKYLENRLQELLSQADDTVSGMTSANENFPDPTDRASLEADRNFLLRIRDRESKLIKKIKQALDRIENGTYGICESCGEEISVKRLKARPVTTQCIECKAKEEALEKALGI